MRNMGTNNNNQSSDERLNELSETFKPEDVKILLNFQNDASLEECKQGVIKAIEVVMEYATTGIVPKGAKLLSVVSNHL